MTEDKKESYLTEKVVDRINNIVIVSVLLGMCISTSIDTLCSRYTPYDWVVPVVVGVAALVFVIISLEYLGQFRIKKEAE